MAAPTTTTSKKFNTFLSRPLQDSALNEVPGVGHATLLKLTQANVDSTEKLIGMYLSNGRSQERMKHWLVSACSIRAQEAGKITDALDRKTHSMMLLC